MAVGSAGQSLGLFRGPFKGSFKGDIGPYRADIGPYWQYFGLWACSCGCLKRVSKSVEVTLNVVGAVVVLTRIVLK